MSDIILRLIKTFDIFILGNIYLFFGTVASSFMAFYIAKPYDHKKSKLKNLLQLILETGLIMVSVYLIRQFVKNVIPNPLKGFHGFDPRRVIEINGGVILAFAFLLYMKDPIKSKVDILYDFFDSSK